MSPSVQSPTDLPIQENSFCISYSELTCRHLLDSHWQGKGRGENRFRSMVSISVARVLNIRHGTHGIRSVMKSLRPPSFPGASGIGIRADIAEDKRYLRRAL